MRQLKDTESEIFALMALKIQAEKLRDDAADRGEAFDLQQALTELVDASPLAPPTLR
ncbi:MAG: hypothetical protein ACPGGK_04200 [Pikeienuella sp.]